MDMDRALSLLISAGIIVFGVWITAYAMPVSLGWTPLGVLTIITGLISLYGATRSIVWPRFSRYLTMEKRSQRSTRSLDQHICLMFAMGRRFNP